MRANAVRVIAASSVITAAVIAMPSRAEVPPVPTAVVVELATTPAPVAAAAAPITTVDTSPAPLVAPTVPATTSPPVTTKRTHSMRGGRGCPSPRDYPAGWYRLAQKESGGRWHIHGRYSGGLQFTGSTWRAYRHCAGASGFSAAHHAPPETQIAVARYVLGAQGVCAWPLSSKKLGVARCGY